MTLIYFSIFIFHSTRNSHIGWLGAAVSVLQYLRIQECYRPRNRASKLQDETALRRQQAENQDRLSQRTSGLLQGSAKIRVFTRV
jgi:hypothetical protein